METVTAIATVITSAFVIVGGIVFIVMSLKDKNNPNRLF
jgi:hypothetical protein